MTAAGRGRGLSLLTRVFAVLLISLSLQGTHLPSGAMAAEDTITKIVTSDRLSCVVLSSGGVRCWGETKYSLPNQSFPPIGAVTDFEPESKCAITFAKVVRCDALRWDHFSPLGTSTVSQISSGQGNTCALTTAGEVQCWGDNPWGAGTPPANLAKVKSISLSHDNACALDSTSKIRCWGYNGTGLNDVPSDLPAAKQVSTGGWHACALLASGTVRCWGDNLRSQSRVPSDLGLVSYITTGANHSCAITIANLVRCWGDLSAEEASTPSDLGPVIALSSAGYNNCAITLSKLVRCWGSNRSGQTDVPLEYGTATPSAPLAVELTSVSWNRMSAKVSGVWKTGDGNKTFTVIDQRTGAILCSVAAPSMKSGLGFAKCEFAAKLGDNVRVGAYATNQVGQSESVLSKLTMFCYKKNNIRAETVTPRLPKPGDLVSVRVSLINLCLPQPKTLKVRFKTYGTNWSKWEEKTFSSSKILISSRPRVTTQLQITGVIDKVVQTTSTTINVYPKVEMDITTGRIYTPQGFPQGGVIEFDLKANREFSGVCSIVAETPKAFNFALTWMGREVKSASFYVQNGRGTGRVAMKWNGQTAAKIACLSPQYPLSSFTWGKDLLFKAKF